MTYQPYQIFNTDAPARWVTTADHAANTVPRFINGGDLGIDAADMQRHIAYDIGAAGVAQALAECLGGPAICSNFSRLVIDPNRGMKDPTLVMKLYDGTIIPANRHVGARERNERLERCYLPYHSALRGLIAERAKPVVLSVHSFTPQLRGRPPRPWQVGVLSAHDRRLADPLLDILRAEPDLTVGDNEPYKGHLPGDALDQHALSAGHANVLIELRNDLIETPQQQRAWAERLAPHLEHALLRANL